MNLCYTVEPGQETERQKRHREYAAKLALNNKKVNEGRGHCRCSTEDGVFLRDLYERGCPLHPKKKNIFQFYRQLEEL